MSATPPHPDLRSALLAPRSVALVGVSDDKSKTTARPLMFLRRAGWSGRLYPVNSRCDTVQGERAWPSLAALPEVPDHAFILAPTQAAVAAVEECAALGVSAATVLAGGFSEVGPEGLALEARLRDAARRGGVRLLGPNSIGLVNLHEKLLLTANAAFAESDLPAGGIFAASHSGSLIGALVSRGKARGIGFAGLVSVGAEADLSIGEICAATLDDVRVTGYLLFLENLRASAALRDFARGAAAHGKAVVAYKLGRSAVAAELAVSHTGALAGEDDVADAFLKDCGIARVDTFEALLEAVSLVGRVPLAPTRRRPTVGVIATTGGGAAMVVDQLGVRGIDATPPSAGTWGRLSAAGIPGGSGRIVDATLAGTKYAVMKPALDAMLSAPEFDLVVIVVGSSARLQPELVVRPVIDCAGAPKPIAAFLVPDAPHALERLAAAGIASFRTPEGCADAIAASFSRRFPKPAAEVLLRAPAEPGRVLDEWEAYALLDRIGVPHAPSLVVKADAERPPLPFPYPLVAKVLSAHILHKSDVGGVVVGIPDEAALISALADIRSNVRRYLPAVPVRSFLVQPVMQGVGEVLVGYRRDPSVGPVVMVAPGGVLTEIYRDRSLRLAPVDFDTAMEMIGEVRALRALSGYRGKPPGDLPSLARAIEAFSRIPFLHDVSVLEAEMNPLIVRREGEGVVAVDALVRLG